MAETDSNLDLDMDAIIQMVARKHKVLLTEDDPVLVTATLNQLVLESMAANTDRALDALQIRLEEMYWRQSAETKEVAKKMINATINATREAITGTVEVSKKELSASMGRELELFIAQCNEQTNRNKQVKNITLVSGAVAAVSAVVTLGMVLLNL